MTFTPLRRSLLAAGLALCALPFAHAEGSYPERPIKLLVGYSAGGGMDTIARMLAARLPEVLGQQVVVENRAGAAGLIAADAVSKAAPDGYTLLLGESGLLIGKYLNPKMSVDPVSGFTPVAGVFKSPLMIVASNQSPFHTPQELISLAKANPGKYSFATSGIGTVHHLGMELLQARTGAKLLHVPYRGASNIIPDVISGQVPLAVVSAAAGLAQAKGGKLRAVAMMSNDKLPGTENVPPISQAVPGLSVAPNQFVLAPAGTPAPVVAKLNEAIHKVLSSPAMAESAAKQGAVPAYEGPGELAKDLRTESDQWAQVIKQQHITLE